MAVDKTFLMRNIQKKEDMIVAFCMFTNMPFVVCDPETFNDQIWIFDTEEQLQEFAKKYAEKKVLLKGIKFQNQRFLSFFSMLFTIGVNELVFVSESGTDTIELAELVKRPDFSQLPKEQQPLLNPQMQLTGIYFMQELHRRKPNNEKPKLRELEEEMAVNLVRSKFLVALEVDGEKIEKGGKNVRIPCVKNSEGKMFQPVFTDAKEFGKFNKDKNFKASLVEFVNIKKIINDNVEGMVVNPQTLNIVITKDRIPVLLDRFAAKKED